MSEENYNNKEKIKEMTILEKETEEENSDEKPNFNLSSNNKENLIKNKNDEISKVKKRYFGIDLIRVLACYLVMQTHAGEIYYINDEGDVIQGSNNIYPGIFNSLARVCVPLFVMISGYLLLPMKTDYSTFLKKRFTRISFPFIAFCIFYDIYFYIRGKQDVVNSLWNIPFIFLITVLI